MTKILGHYKIRMSTLIFIVEIQNYNKWLKNNQNLKDYFKDDNDLKIYLIQIKYLIFKP